MKASKVIFLVFLIAASFFVVNVQTAEVTENSWAPKTHMPTGRSGLGLAVVETKMYAIGGFYCDKNELYDPAADTWAVKKPMPTARGDFAIAVIGKRIFTFGGRIRYGGNSPPELTDVTEVYDTATDTWASKTSLPKSKAGFSANVVNGKIYLIGGFTYSDFSSHPSNENLVYDPLADSWTTASPIPTAVYDYASAVVDNRIYVISGHGTEYTSVNGTEHIPASNQIYDPETDTWTNGTSMPFALDFGAAAGATTGTRAPKTIYVIGGFTGFYAYNNLNQVYRPENETWCLGAAAPSPLFYSGIAVVQDQLYVMGGMTAILTPSIAENQQYTPYRYGTALLSSQQGFLGSGLPMEYGYALVAVIAVVTVAGVYFIKVKKQTRSKP